LMLSNQFNPDLFGYASYTHGFKSCRCRWSGPVMIPNSPIPSSSA
jgi:hypothetical protein